MRISGTEPSSVISSQTKQFKKMKSDAPKVPKQAKAKKGWCNKPTKLQIFFTKLKSPENHGKLWGTGVKNESICNFQKGGGTRCPEE